LFSSLVLASHSRLVHLDCRFHPPLSSRFRTDLSRLKRRGIITPGRVEESHGKRERVKNSHTSASANELCRSTPHASNHSPFCCSFFSTHSFFFFSTALPCSQIYDLETTVVRDCQPLPSTQICFSFLSFIFSCSFYLYFIHPPSKLQSLNSVKMVFIWLM